MRASIFHPIVMALMVIISLSACKKSSPGEDNSTVQTKGIISTYAGDVEFGYTDGPGNKAQFKATYALFTNAQGNVFIVEQPFRGLSIFHKNLSCISCHF